MRFAETVEVDQQVVPGLLLLVAVLGRFKSKERYAPCERGDKVCVRPDNVEGAPDLTA